MSAGKPYRVIFFKTVTSDYGRDVEICQCTVDVRAEGDDDAVREAKDEFCHRDGIERWSQHADRYKVEPAQPAD